MSVQPSLLPTFATFLVIVVALSGCGGGASQASSLAPIPQTLTVSISSPLSGASVSGTITITAIVSANAVSVQFEVDGSKVGSPVSVSGTNASYSLDTTTLPNGSHTLAAVASDNSGHTASSSLTVTVDNPSPLPTVSVSSPSSGSIVGGSTMLQASVNNGVSVQFQIDGSNVGMPVDSPFIYSLDTTQFPNGPHSVVAIAANAAGSSTTSAAVAFSINNLGQFRMCFATSLAQSDLILETSLSQSGTQLNANPQATQIFLFPSGIGCPQYAMTNYLGSVGGPYTGTFGADTSTGGFSLSFNGGNSGVVNISGLCFDSSHLTLTYCVGPYSQGGGETGDVFGLKMAPFSGTFAGTLSYQSGSITVTVTFTQNKDYGISASYSDAGGTQTLLGSVVGGTFNLQQGFDGNSNTGIEICTGPLQNSSSSCSSFEIWMFDAKWNFVGILTPTQSATVSALHPSAAPTLGVVPRSSL